MTNDKINLIKDRIINRMEQTGKFRQNLMKQYSSHITSSFIRD